MGIQTMRVIGTLVLLLGAAATQEGKPTPLDERIEETEATEQMRFVITPYKPNYLMVGYNDNPDIDEYLGNCELRFADKWNRHTFTLLTRNQLQSGFETGA